MRTGVGWFPKFVAFYLLVGGLTRGLIYLITGASQFLIDEWPGDSRVLIGLWVIPLGFIIMRCLVGVVEGAALTWCLRRRLRRPATLAIAIGWPVGAELYLRANHTLVILYYGCRSGAPEGACASATFQATAGTLLDTAAPALAGWLLGAWTLRVRARAVESSTTVVNEPSRRSPP